jgi:hypothetical protein
MTNMKVMTLFISWILLIIWTGYSVYVGWLGNTIVTFLMGLGLGFFLSLLNPRRQ